jgi:hypothetical protein
VAISTTTSRLGISPVISKSIHTSTMNHSSFRTLARFEGKVG